MNALKLLLLIGIFIIGLVLIGVGIAGTPITASCSEADPECVITYQRQIETGWWIFKTKQNVGYGFKVIGTQPNIPAGLFGIVLVVGSVYFLTKSNKEDEKTGEKKYERKTSGKYFWSGIILLFILTPLATMLFLPLALIPFILGIYDLYRSTKVEKIPEKREAPKKEESETGKVKEIVYMRCPKCKAKNEEDAKYCKKCGNKL